VATIKDDEDSDDEDIRTMLQTMRERSKFPDDYKIPPKAWKLLSPEARDAFIAERDKAVKSGTAGGPSSGKPIPKQYGGAGQDTTDTRQANLGVTAEEDASESESDDSEPGDEDALVRLLRSYKASRHVSRFIGMARATTASRTIHVNVDPSRVRSLLSKLSKTDAVAVTDGGCDTGLLGAGWYISEYTG
jgi:hypothetical protein